MAVLAGPLSAVIEQRPGRMHQLVLVAAAVALTVATGLALAAADLLRGPVLGGGDPVGEALIVGSVSVFGALATVLITRGSGWCVLAV